MPTINKRRDSKSITIRRAEVVREVRLRQAKRYAMVSLGAAAAVLMALAVVAFFRVVPVPTVSMRFNDGAVSQIQRGLETMVDGDVMPGDRLLLERGAVELAFSQGVRALIEAPALVEFVDGNAVRMDYGVGYFHIEREEATGFTLDLPASRVIDHGTSFGVIAPAGGAAEIHLIDGQVRIQRMDGDPVSAVEMKPGRAYREDDSSPSGYAMVPFRGGRFVRHLPDRLDYLGIDVEALDREGAFTTTGRLPGRIREVGLGGGGVATVPGRSGTALHFDGGGSHLEIQGWAAFQHRPSGTLSFWMRIPEGRHQLRICPVAWGAPHRDDVGRWSVAIDPEADGLALSIRAGFDPAYHLAASSRLGYDTWHHLAFVFDPKANGDVRVRAIVDGREEPESLLVPAPDRNVPDHPLIVGNHHDPALWRTHAFKGEIEDLRVFWSALDAEDLASQRDVVNE